MTSGLEVNLEKFHRTLLPGLIHEEIDVELMMPYEKLTFEELRSLKIRRMWEWIGHLNLCAENGETKGVHHDMLQHTIWTLQNTLPERFSGENRRG